MSDDSAKSIGKMVGTGAIVTGSLTNIGTLYRLTIKAIDVEKAVVAVSFPADITNDERVRALLGQSGVAALPRSSATQNSTPGSTLNLTHNFLWRKIFLGEFVRGVLVIFNHGVKF
ncbi:hypothetical protein FACS1894190_10200 [Spirochaetia bacterium]|nr:hypothetical protein FACS1894190_10200 [Spirochaetia bacterium]